MFLSTNYILGNEVAEKMKIKISNISQAKYDLENLGNYDDIIKYGNCTFLNKESKMIPKNLQIGMKAYTYTPMEQMLPASYVCSEFQISTTALNALIKDPKVPEFKKMEVVASKNFVKFDMDFINKIEGSVLSVINYTDLQESLAQNYIDGYLKITPNRYLSWYYA